MTIEWVNYFILSGLLAFLLTLHCLMYTKINKRCNVRVMKRNRVQILVLSLILTGSMFIKLTFLLDVINLVLLLFA